MIAAADKYVEAAERRRLILAYVSAHPGTTARAVWFNLNCYRLGIPFARVSQLLDRLGNLGEVKREEGGVSPAPFSRPCARYYPRAASTMTAAEMKAKLGANLKSIDGRRQIVKSQQVEPAAIPRNTRLFGGI